MPVDLSKRPSLTTDTSVIDEAAPPSVSNITSHKPVDLSLRPSNRMNITLPKDAMEVEAEKPGPNLDSPFMTDKGGHTVMQPQFRTMAPANEIVKDLDKHFDNAQTKFSNYTGTHREIAPISRYIGAGAIEASRFASNVANDPFSVIGFGKNIINSSKPTAIEASEPIINDILGSQPIRLPKPKLRANLDGTFTPTDMKITEPALASPNLLPKITNKSRKIDLALAKQRSADYGKLGEEINLWDQETPKVELPDGKELHAGIKITKENVADVANLWKTLKSSFDVSAPFRQGINMVGRKQFWTSMKPMLKSFTSENNYNKVVKGITNNPNFDLAQAAGLDLTDVGHLAPHEEGFLSDFARKIPGVKASSRAYSAFLNSTRMGVFEDLLAKTNSSILLDKIGQPLLSKSGDVQANNAAKSLASYINSATGRGDIGRLKPIASELNAVLFSPKLLKSRFDILNPMFYAKLTPEVRQEALKDLFKTSSAITGILSLAGMAGVEVTANPINADFGKMRFGKTRLDFTGGYGSYIRAAAQITSKLNDTVKGKAQGYGKRTGLNVAEQFAENKLSPFASMITTMLKGSDINGKPISIPAEIGAQFVPLIIQDMKDIFTTDPGLLPLLIPDAFGVTTQTYSSRSKNPLSTSVK